MQPMLKRVVVLSTLCVLLTGCPHMNEPRAGQVEIELIGLEALPPEARFAPIGSIGTAYRLQGQTGEARFALPQGAAATLLPATMRLFRFDERFDRWIEIGESRYDAQNRELVGEGLDPGIYTAFGWSANPAENAVQRLLLDSSLGYGGLTNPPRLSSGPDSSSDRSIGEFRRDLLLSWLEVSFSFPVTVCWLKDTDSCEEMERGHDCRHRADLEATTRQRKVRRDCKLESGFDCPQPACCECDTRPFPERAIIPTDFLDTLPLPCGSGLTGPHCPICPTGLSCPTGRLVDLPQIEPTLDSPDYGFLQDLGVGVVTEDPVFRDDFHDLVEAITGKQYPVPPPWP